MICVCIYICCVYMQKHTHNIFICYINYVYFIYYMYMSCIYIYQLRKLSKIISEHKCKH